MTTFSATVVTREGRPHVHPLGDHPSAALLDWWRTKAEPPAGFRVVRGQLPALGSDAAERPIAVDQTNRSVIVGDAVVVKWATGPLTGPHPGADRLRRLAAAGFDRMPALVGIVEWQTPDGHWIPAVSMQRYLPGAVDGWTWCLAEARIALGLAPGRGRPFAAALGDLAGQMHLALVEPKTGLVAVHGDFHIGQILRDPAGQLFVIDFDGNPTLAPAERIRLRPAAYDIAGMLLSLENVGHVVSHYHPEVPQARIVEWTDTVQEEFRVAYRHLAADLLDESLLPGLIDDQIGREFAYATDHLPEWRYVPEAAMTRRGRSWTPHSS